MEPGAGLGRARQRHGWTGDPKVAGYTQASERTAADRRDAIKLARFLASGHLTAIRVPTPEEDALRDLVRLREDVKIKEMNTKRQLSSLMLRHGRIFTEGKVA